MNSLEQGRSSMESPTDAQGKHPRVFKWHGLLNVQVEATGRMRKGSTDFVEEE